MNPQQQNPNNMPPSSMPGNNNPSMGPGVNSNAQFNSHMGPNMGGPNGPMGGPNGPNGVAPNGQSGNYLNVHLICETASRLLFLSVHWVKAIPAFSLLR